MIDDAQELLDQREPGERRGLPCLRWRGFISIAEFVGPRHESRFPGDVRLTVSVFSNRVDGYVSLVHLLAEEGNSLASDHRLDQRLGCGQPRIRAKPAVAAVGLPHLKRHGRQRRAFEELGGRQLPLRGFITGSE